MQNPCESFGKHSLIALTKPRILSISLQIGSKLIIGQSEPKAADCRTRLVFQQSVLATTGAGAQINQQDELQFVQSPR